MTPEEEHKLRRMAHEKEERLTQELWEHRDDPEEWEDEPTDVLVAANPGVVYSIRFTADEFREMICRQFDVLYREGAESGRVMAIALHPYLTGVPHRIDAFDAALDHICRHERVWKATGAEIARHFAAQTTP